MSPETAEPHLDVLLVTADLPAATDFWREVIGAHVEATTAEAATLRVGPQRIRIVAPDPPPPRHPGGLYAGNGYRVVGLVLDDADAVRARIEARGRRVANGGDLPGSWPVRFARDPDGTMLELIGPPPEGHRSMRAPVQVGLTVADADRMRRFYGEVLGLPEETPAPIAPGVTRHAFRVGDSTLKLWSPPGERPSFAGPPAAALGVRGVRLPVASVEAALAALARHGIEAAGDPALPAHGGAHASAWIVDPEGGWIELAEPADRATRRAPRG